MKKALCLMMALTLLLASGCARADAKRFTKTEFDLFDSAVTLIGFAGDQAAFDRVSDMAFDELKRLHQVFDKYNEYEGIGNLYVLNRDACVSPVAVEKELFELLAFVKREQPKLRGSVNIAMGGVLALWHDYRENGLANPQIASLPPMENLKEAAKSQNLDDVILDEQNKTVYFQDPALQLDLGAVAKGYAAELVARALDASDMPSYILNAGGNVRVGQPPLDGRSAWSIGIQDPDASYGSQNIDVVYGSNLSVVTSGDYERYYTVDGVRYAHIISPDTLMPAVNNRSVTVVSSDSALCDLLSTALFVLPYEDGLAVLKSYPGTDAYWVTATGDIHYTDGLAGKLKSNIKE